jgi:cytidylate kinase
MAGPKLNRGPLSLDRPPAAPIRAGPEDRPLEGDRLPAATNGNHNAQGGDMALDHRQVIAIDGPGAAGKSTVAERLATDMGAILFDTGALYRTVTLLAERHGVQGSDAAGLAELALRHAIDITAPSVQDGRQVDVLLDGEDVTWLLRTPAIDARVSEVSAHPMVREALLDLQRTIADGARVVMVGRDIGTVVIPRAGVKIYLDASVEERARRRFAELEGRGVDADYDQVLADLRARDAYDTNRETAPLTAAPDALTVISDGKSVDDIVAEISAAARKVWTTADE